MKQLDQLIADFASFVWCLPLLIVLIGGGVYLLILSGCLPIRQIRAAGLQTAARLFRAPRSQAETELRSQDPSRDAFRVLFFPTRFEKQRSQNQRTSVRTRRRGTAACSPVER